MTIDQASLDWLTTLCEPEDEVLRSARAISEEEEVPLVSHAVGATLRWLAGIGPAHDVIEVGGGVGYSGLWLLGGMDPRGMLTTIEIDPDRQSRAQRVLSQAGHGQRVRAILGAALTVLPKLADRSYDLVFLDGVKAEYPDYLVHARRLLRPGGLLVADNLLFGGRAVEPKPDDPAGRGIHAFAEAVRDDRSLQAVPLPVGDGLMVAKLRSV